MGHMSAELSVSSGAAKERVKLAHGRVFPLITPCEVSILQMDLLQLAILKCVTEAITMLLFTFLSFLSLARWNRLKTPKASHITLHVFLSISLAKAAYLQEDAVDPYTEVMLK